MRGTSFGAPPGPPTPPPPIPASSAPDARPAAVPVHGVGAGAPGPRRVGAIGCLVVGALTLVVLGVGVVLAGRDGGTSAPTWSSAYAAAFEAACRSDGTSSEACRCLRGELEQRFPEDRMLDVQRRVARGTSPSAEEQANLRAAEQRCG